MTPLDQGVQLFEHLMQFRTSRHQARDQRLGLFPETLRRPMVAPEWLLLSLSLRLARGEHAGHANANDDDASMNNRHVASFSVVHFRLSGG